MWGQHTRPILGYLFVALGGQRRIGQRRSFHRCPFLGHPMVVLFVSDGPLIFKVSFRWCELWLNYRNGRALYRCVRVALSSSTAERKARSRPDSNWQDVPVRFPSPAGGRGGPQPRSRPGVSTKGDPNQARIGERARQRQTRGFLTLRAHSLISSDVGLQWRLWPLAFLSWMTIKT